MKKIFRLFTLAVAGLFALSSCEDVPAPYPTPNPEIVDNGEEDNTEIAPEGDGTEANPFNVAAAVELCNSLGADIESSGNVYIKGKVAENKTTDATISLYGNMTFTIIDEGNEKTTFTAFQVYGPGKKKFTAVDQIKSGDEVIVCGKVVNYKGNTPETVGKGSAYVVSINGKSEGSDTPADDPADTPTAGTAEGDGSEANPFNVAGINAYMDGNFDTNKEVYFTGIITKFKSGEEPGNSYGNATFYISEDGKTGGEDFYCYRVMGFNGEKFTSATQLKVGDKVVIKSPVTIYTSSYGSTKETVSGKGQLVSINGKAEYSSGEQGGSGSTDTPSGDAGEFASNITVATGANAYTDGLATVNGIENVATVKIGTSKAAGDFTFSVPSGKLTFYAVTWKGAGSADVQFKDGSTVVKTVTVKANDGASGNAPYTMTVTSGDKYEIEVPAGKTITVTSEKRVIFFGMQSK